MIILEVKLTGAESTHVRKLVKLGIFGKTPAAVIEGILNHGLQRLVEKNHLQHPRRKKRQVKP